MSPIMDSQLAEDIMEGEMAIDADRRAKGTPEKRVIIETGEVWGTKRRFLQQLYDLCTLRRERLDMEDYEDGANPVHELIDHYIACGLKAEEIETPASLIKECTEVKPSGTYSVCEVTRRWGTIASSVHATHDPGKNAAYLKFQATRPDERGKGISQTLLADVLYTMNKKLPISRLSLEGVAPARGYWEGVSLTRTGLGAMRPYGRVDSKSFQQKRYRRPDLAPNPDTGEDGAGGPICEHFHSVYRAHDNQFDPRVPRRTLEQQIADQWDAWYMVDADDSTFTPKARQRRNEIVHQVRKEVFESVPPEVKEYHLLSREMCQYLRDVGYDFDDDELET